MSTVTPIDPMAVVLDIGRRVTLMNPDADKFDELPMLSPIERVKRVATVVVEAAQQHEYLRDQVNARGVMQAFQLVARQRVTGDVGLPMLQPDLTGEAHKPRETA